MDGLIEEWMKVRTLVKLDVSMDLLRAPTLLTVPQTSAGAMTPAATPQVPVMYQALYMFWKVGPRGPRDLLMEKQSQSWVTLPPFSLSMMDIPGHLF